MRIKTETTVFVTIGKVHERTAAAVSQNIQRTIAEQTVEIVRISFGMAGIVLALPVAEVRKMFPIKIFFHLKFLLKNQSHRNEKPNKLIQKKLFHYGNSL